MLVSVISIPSFQRDGIGTFTFYYELFKVHSANFLFIFSHICLIVSNFRTLISALFNGTLDQYSLYALIYIRVAFLPAYCGDSAAVDLSVYGSGFIINGNDVQFILAAFSISLRQHLRICLTQTITSFYFCFPCDRFFVLVTATADLQDTNNGYAEKTACHKTKKKLQHNAFLPNAFHDETNKNDKIRTLA